MRPERESRPAANRAASDVLNLDTPSIPHDPHCCGVLDLESLRECTRRGITCGLTRCARWELAVVGLREGRVSA